LEQDRTPAQLVTTVQQEAKDVMEKAANFKCINQWLFQGA